MDYIGEYTKLINFKLVCFIAVGYESSICGAMFMLPFLSFDLGKPQIKNKSTNGFSQSFSAEIRGLAKTMFEWVFIAITVYLQFKLN